MTIVATSRVRRRRGPLAESSIFSLMLEPLKRSVSRSSCPSRMSEPSPGSHWKVSVPAPPNAVSLPWLPSMKSAPEPPSRVSAPLEPRTVSAPAPASIVIAVIGARLPEELAVSSPPPSVT